MEQHCACSRTKAIISCCLDSPFIFLGRKKIILVSKVMFVSEQDCCISEQSTVNKAVMSDQSKNGGLEVEPGAVTPCEDFG